ncbi:hypothetical protein BXU09_17440 [Deinococcus sp. LM3]|nr:hypothetical protein BXU09_17440 [Deinococcus sp. LM3]
MDNGLLCLPPAEFAVHLITTDREGAARHAHQFASIAAFDYFDEDVIRALSAYLITTYGITSVVGTTEKVVLWAALLRAQFGLPGASPDVIERMRDKVRMKERLTLTAVRTPAYTRVHALQDIVDFQAQFGRIVLKPTAGVGSMGLQILDTPAQVLALDKGHFSDGAWQVEEFIDGHMLHCDFIALAGQIQFCSVSQYVTPPGRYQDDYFGGSFIVTDAGLQERVRQIAQEIVQAFEFETGVCHLELFHTPRDELVFCEIAARPGGGGIEWPVQHLYGINLFSEHVRVSCVAPDTMTYPRLPLRAGTAGYVGLLARPGFEVTNIQSFSGHPNIKRESLRIAVGSRLGGPRHCTDYMAHFFVTAEDRSEFQEIVTHLCRGAVSLRPFSGPEVLNV